MDTDVYVSFFKINYVKMAYVVQDLLLGQTVAASVTIYPSLHEAGQS